MLASFLVLLRPRRSSPLGRSVGRSLHAVLLRMVAQTDPDLATRLHAEARYKPFTVSMLQEAAPLRAGRPPIYPTTTVPSRVYAVRYTVLDDAVFAALATVLAGKQFYGDPVDIDGYLYDIEDVVADPKASGGWGAITSFEQLLDTAGLERRIQLEFASPTVIRQRGDEEEAQRPDLLFPLPGPIYGGCLRRWQALSPSPLDDEGLLDFIDARLAVERYELATTAISYGQRLYRGFTGRCTYYVTEQALSYIRLLNLLSDFFLFCGAGWKTTQGMGQVRRI